MQLKTALLLITIALSAIGIKAASYNYSQCTAKAYLNTANLKCVNCPANQIANTYQSIATACQCAIGFSPSGNGACSSLTSATCGSTTNTYYPVYSLSGSFSSVSSCASCAGNAYTNR